MKSKFFSFCFSLILSTFVFAQSQTTKSAQTATNEDLVKLVKDCYDAWNTLNLDQPAKFYAKDADLIFYDVTPLKYNGWSEYRKGVEKLLTGYSSLKLVPNNDLKISRAGKAAWATLTFHLITTTKDGKKSDEVGRDTIIWQKRAGQWLIVHEHVSLPLGAPAAQ